jgi:Tfp pilus assembly pilus retraction ATPase PilT
MSRIRVRRSITMEDPTELLPTDDSSSLSRREIGSDRGSFAGERRPALRQEPDVIRGGEIREGETMGVALNAEETGRRVRSTLHKPDVACTTNRILPSPERGTE